MRNIIASILLLVVSYATAQVPGYQGLKFTVKYNCGINHPAIVGRTGKLPMLYHNGSIEYVVGRAWSIGAKYGFMTYNSPPNKAFRNKSTYLTLAKDGYNGRYTQHVATFYGKYFFKKRGFIAPIGPYITIGGYYQYGTNNIAAVISTIDGDAVGYHRVKFHYAGLNFGMGRSFVVASRVIIDLGFDLNITLPNPTLYNSNSGDGELSAFNDLVFRNFFQLHLGLGVLAF